MKPTTYRVSPLPRSRRLTSALGHPMHDIIICTALNLSNPSRDSIDVLAQNLSRGRTRNDLFAREVWEGAVTEGAQKLIDEIWADDLLRCRKDEAEFLHQFLTSRATDRALSKKPGAYVLNIDAEWGSGKTFFLDRLAKQFEISHIVAHVNAWRDDHMDDPFIAILAAIDEALKPFLKQEKKAAKLWTALKKNAAPIAVKTITGVGKNVLHRTLSKETVGDIANVISGAMTDLPAGVKLDSETLKSAAETAADEIVTEIDKVIDSQAQKLIDSFNAKNAASSDFKSRLEAAIGALTNKRTPLFVVIDELDRCRPSYAVALLERVKHLFDAKNLVFIFATNSEQLQHSIAGAYGTGFDGFRYLKRFFDTTYRLKTPSTENIVEVEATTLFLDRLTSPLETPVAYLKFACNAYIMDIRQIKNVLDTIRIVSAGWKAESKIELVSLFALAFEFDTTGNCSWQTSFSEKYNNINFSIDPPADNWRGKKPVEFNVANFMNIFYTNTKILKNMVDLADSEMDRVKRYAYTTVSSEWGSNRQVNINAPSVQFQLPEMVMAAGRMNEGT